MLGREGVILPAKGREGKDVLGTAREVVVSPLVRLISEGLPSDLFTSQRTQAYS